MIDLGWYVNRLRSMSVREVGFRAARRIYVERLKNQAIALPPAARMIEQGPLPPLQLIDVDPAPYLALANAAADGRQPCLGLDDAPFGPDFGWARDPKTGTRAPLTFGMALNYKDESLVGDIKYLWEPNRHLHIPTLAQAYRLSGNVEYLHSLATHISSWIDQNPYRRGPNWSSALEVGIRTINWSIAWQMLGGQRGIDEIQRHDDFPVQAWLSSVYQHLQFASSFYSRHSSANNHLIGEAAGVYIGSVTWPFWDNCPSWGADAREILIGECARQSFADGVNREQAIAYQAFTLEFLLLAAAVGRSARQEFPAAYWHRMGLMAEFIAELMDTEGDVPQIGDSDDALVVQLAPDAQKARYTSLVSATGRLLGRNDLVRTDRSGGDRARWICALAGVAVEATDLERRDVQAHGRSAGMIRSFPEGGYHVLRGGGSSCPDVRVVFDAGPLGYLSIAAHGHADALAILLSVEGREVLVDSGTYAYHTESEWRSYFRGTSAHNTIVVDGLDQSVSGGNFMWTRHATARCTELASEEDLIVGGEHNGYHRLSDPVTHRRTVRLAKTGERLTVADRLECRKRHRIEIWWHFAEACEVTVSGNVVRAVVGPCLVEMIADHAGCEVIQRRGSVAPHGGWISRRFGVKAPITSVAWALDIDGPTHVNTTFAISRSN
jgi:hypothetical protein